MASPAPDAKSVFCEALERPPGAERAAFLDGACVGDEGLRAKVEELLAAHDRAGRFLAPGPAGATAADPDRTTYPAGAAARPVDTGGFAETVATEAGVMPETLASETLPAAGRATGEFRADGTAPTIEDATRADVVAGRVIAGRYTLRAVLGEGGMGTVYRAEQTAPVRRPVALKVIRGGMDSRSILARFDAERQALALMDHPNIARVFDGGTTDAGQPFFVMELVRGEPITAYCDRNRLTVPARLELFVAVCQAVQHAHQKGIIHRDLKPNNVLVTDLDGRPTPKVIDFGVAKATEFDLTDQSLGDTGAIVGTPAYMSPEQADPSSMDIDTRTDVYALGVILYELLAGSPPLDPAQFRRGALLEMLRMVREVDPPRPSTKVSTAEALPSIAAGRGIEPAQLRRALSGDLDWIVMKALEKDRARRYETANGLAADVQRHLASEPVLAAPPSRSYRLRKFARKHRGGVIAAGLVLGVLLLGIAGTTWGWYAARRSAASERLARLDAEKQQGRAERREDQAIDAVKRFRDAVAGEPELKNNPALEALRRRLLKEPLAFFKDLRDRLQADKDTRPESLKRLAEAGHELGVLTAEIGDERDALTAYGEALAIYRKLADANPSATELQIPLAAIHNNIGLLLSAIGKPAEALKVHGSALAIRRRLADANPSATGFQNHLAASHNAIANVLRDSGKPAEALKEYESALAIYRELADAHPTVAEFQDALANIYNSFGLLLSATGKPAEALKAHESALVIQRELADANPTVTLFQDGLAHIYTNIGLLLGAIGKPAEAMKAHESALAILRKLAQEHPESPDLASGLGGTLNNVALLDVDAKRFPEARDRLREAIAWQRKALATNPAHPAYRRFLGNHLNALRVAAQELSDAEGVAEAQRELAKFRDSDPAMAALDGRLAAIIRGVQQPRDEADRLALAQRAYDKALYATAARLWGEALAADPKLGDDRQAQHRYNAACAAALAGCARGKDDPPPDEVERARLRRQALDWLRADLAAWAKRLGPGSNTPQARSLGR